MKTALSGIRHMIKITQAIFEERIKEIAERAQHGWINPFCDKHNVSFVRVGNKFMFVKCRAGIEGYGLPAEITERAWETPPEDYAPIYEILTIECSKGLHLFEYMRNYNGGYVL